MSQEIARKSFPQIDKVRVEKPPTEILADAERNVLVIIHLISSRQTLSFHLTFHYRSPNMQTYEAWVTNLESSNTRKSH